MVLQPERRGPLRRRWMTFKRWLFHKECKGEHKPRRFHFRQKHSRYYVALSVCVYCGAVLDVEGRRER